MSWTKDTKHSPALEAVESPRLTPLNTGTMPPGYNCHNCHTYHAPSVSTTSDYGAMWATPNTGSPIMAQQLPVVMTQPPGARMVVPNGVQAQAFATATMQNGQMVLVYPATDWFCPATGGSHDVRRRQGGVSIILSILTFPLGLLTLPFDRKRSCRRCNYVLREAWGGCAK